MEQGEFYYESVKYITAFYEPVNYLWIIYERGAGEVARVNTEEWAARICKLLNNAKKETS